jgi:hypothetical protein
MAESPDQSEIIRRLCNIVEGMIEEAIYVNWLHGTAKPTVEVVPAQTFGATDAIMLQAKVELELFVKFHPRDARKEELGYELLRTKSQALSRNLIHPLPTTGTTFGTLPLWLTPRVDAITLHELVCGENQTPRTNKEVEAVYDDILQKLRTLWYETAATPALGLPQEIYVGRVRDRFELLKQRLKEPHLEDFEIVVDAGAGEKEYGTFGSIIEDFEAQLEKHKLVVSCTTHGDEHAKNLMVLRARTSGTPPNWVIIDYVNTREYSDWLFSIAKMLHWWDFYHVLELAKTNEELRKSLQADWTLDKTKKRLVLSYDGAALAESVHPLCAQLGKKVHILAEEVAKHFNEEEPAWYERLQLATFAVVFGSVAGHVDAADFAVPIMLAQGLKALRS